jgi:hypothetical protein
MTIYPHLDKLMTALNTGLSLDYPVMAYAALDQVSIQGTPSVCLVPEDAQVAEMIKSGRTIAAMRIQQEWLILTVLRDAGDQKVTAPLITQLGEWQARILQILMKDILSVGGPIRILDMPKADAIEGGAIAGKIRIGTQFVVNAE